MGTVSAEQAGVVDCLAGVTVALLREGQPVDEQQTDAFGDFKFDRLDADSGAYELSITADGFAAATVEMTLGQTQNVGEVRLSAL